jgi:hypothetical protein
MFGQVKRPQICSFSRGAVWLGNGSFAALVLFGHKFIFIVKRLIWLLTLVAVGMKRFVRLVEYSFHTKITCLVRYKNHSYREIGEISIAKTFVWFMMRNLLVVTGEMIHLIRERLHLVCQCFDPLHENVLWLNISLFFLWTKWFTWTLVEISQKDSVSSEYEPHAKS